MDFHRCFRRRDNAYLSARADVVVAAAVVSASAVVAAAVVAQPLFGRRGLVVVVLRILGRKSITTPNANANISSLWFPSEFCIDIQ
jgi:hypothetical protein